MRAVKPCNNDGVFGLSVIYCDGKKKRTYVDRCFVLIEDNSEMKTYHPRVVELRILRSHSESLNFGMFICSSPPNIIYMSSILNPVSMNHYLLSVTRFICWNPNFFYTKTYC